MRVATYTRVSTKDKGQDPENQARELSAAVTARGWKIVREYCDRDTGGKATRVAFQQMFGDAMKTRKPFDLVMVWSLDRFTREGVFETHQHLKRLDDAGVRFVSLKEPYLDTVGMFRDVIISLLACLAKQERIRHQERTVAGLQRARAQGKVFGRRKVQLNRHQMKALREMVAKDWTVRQIAGALRLSKATAYRWIVRIREE